MSTQSLLADEQPQIPRDTSKSSRLTSMRTRVSFFAQDLVGDGTDYAHARTSVMETGNREDINAWVSKTTSESYLKLPYGSFSEEVTNYILATKDPDIAQCLGPAVPSLYIIGVLEVAAMICFFPITYLATAYNHVWWLQYMILVPFVFYRHHVEWNALQHFIPPYIYDGIRTTDSLWPVFGLNGSFQQWRFVELFFSILGSVDNFLDTGFAAATVYVLVNDGGQTQQVYEDNVGFLWNSIGMNCPQFLWGVILMWLCTLALPVAHLLFTIPKGPVKYEIGDSGLQHYLFQRLNFEGVFFFLSAATGMSTIQSLEFRQGTHELNRIEPEVMISYVQPMGTSMLKRVCYSYLMRNSLQLNIQALIFSIHLHTGDTRTQTQTAVSMAVGIIMAVKKLAAVFAFEEYIADAKSRWASDEDLEKYIEEHPANHLFRIWKLGFWKVELAIRFSAGLTAVMLVTAGLRLFMATFVCESHLFVMIGGCVPEA